MARHARIWAPIASALLLLGAFPPINLPLLVLVALVPWLNHLRQPDARGFKTGYLFGLVFAAGQMFWLLPFVGRWTGSLGLAAIPWVLACAFLALYFGLAGWLIQIAYRNGWGWLVPLLWVGVEIFRSYIPIFAFPWGLVATPLWIFPPAIQGAAWGTIFLVSAWCILANEIVSRLTVGEGFLKVRYAAILFVAFMALSIAQYSAPVEGKPTRILVGQPGVDMAFGNRGVQDRDLGRAVADLYAQARGFGAQLMVLPEGLSRPSAAMPPTTPFTVESDIPVVFGGQRGTGPTYQSAYAFDGRWDVADKTRLVIFGEFVPGRRWMPFLNKFNLPTGDLTAGERLSPVRTGGITVGPVICFESLFPDISFRQARAGAQVLAVMSIDDWYMGTNAPEQLMASSVWRAVETGMPLVRSASLGRTVAISPRGDIVGAVAIGGTRGLAVTMPLPERGRPFAGLFAFPTIALLSIVGVPIANRLLRRRAAKT